MRRGTPVLFACTVAAAGCGRAGADEPPRLVVGAPAPAALAAGPREEAVVGWVVRPEQGPVTCETAALQLRRLHRRFGSRLRVAVVTTERDSGFVRRFMRRERLAGVALVALPDTGFRASFGSAERPALWLAVRGRLAARFPADRAVLQDGVRSMQMERAAEALLAHGGVPETLPSSAPDRGGPR